MCVLVSKTTCADTQLRQTRVEQSRHVKSQTIQTRPSRACLDPRTPRIYVALSPEGLRS